jgi:hypothetical protein
MCPGVPYERALEACISVPSRGHQNSASNIDQWLPFVDILSSRSGTRTLGRQSLHICFAPIPSTCDLFSPPPPISNLATIASKANSGRLGALLLMLHL